MRHRRAGMPRPMIMPYLALLGRPEKSHSRCEILGAIYDESSDTDHCLDLLAQRIRSKVTMNTRVWRSQAKLKMSNPFIRKWSPDNRTLTFEIKYQTSRNFHFEDLKNNYLRITASEVLSSKSRTKPYKSNRHEGAVRRIQTGRHGPWQSRTHFYQKESDLSPSLSNVIFWPYYKKKEKKKRPHPLTAYCHNCFLLTSSLNEEFLWTLDLNNSG